tara:strand:+ start:246 stop:452 length:207 start_codon:yes stop_codon:yes gene_type:complete
VVEAVALAVLVVMLNIQIILVQDILIHHIIHQLGPDGELLVETVAMENQILLFHQQILQVMFPNPHFH